MKSAQAPRAAASRKVSTGIAGFDEITAGGLPRGRTTLLTGGPGSGKTLFCLQSLVHGAQDCSEPGIFVAFEESSQRIVGNAEGFGWKLAQLRRKKLCFIDAQPQPDLVSSGDFDLAGLLAALSCQMATMPAQRIVFDALDIVLALLPDAAAQRREIFRLHEWLLANQLTGLITAKAGGDEANPNGPLGFMQFMVDCAVVLNHRVVQGVSQRNLRVQKFRGSSFDEDESPFLIGSEGLSVAVARSSHRVDQTLITERISSGVERLDAMLGGGYYRGASVLITGSPGTAKTTLSGAFAAAGCQRGERTLFITLDSEYTEVARNLASVGIRLDAHVRSGYLHMAPARIVAGSAEVYLGRLKTLVKAHGTRCLVIDPISAWSGAGNALAARSVAERLIDWLKADGVTLLCTGLLDETSSREGGGASLQISTLADTWLHLNHLVQAGERNRGLSIIKSRGTAHSNQVRELILSDSGVTLADTYASGGEVLMGTLRWEKERAEGAAQDAADAAANLKHVRLDAEAVELEVRLKSLQTELAAKRHEKALLARSTQSRDGELSRGRTRMQELRGAEAALSGDQASPPS